MSPSQVIVLATPVFLALVVAEFAWGRIRGRNTYRLADALTSMGLGMLSQVSAVLTGLLRIGIYTAAYQSVALVHADAFWTTWWGALLALVLYDFCYYWLHRLGHESAVLWAAHVVHHHSEHYNLSTALRQTSSGALLGWVFYLPMALAGVPPLVFGIVALVDLLYQFWVHTEHVGRLGWFDRVFCSPSNHRVHHAVNEAYLDRNYGGVLVVWDRLFGTFREEAEPCVYGTRTPLRSWDPLWANVEVYWGLAKLSWRTKHWPDKLRVWVKPPGWLPPDIAALEAKPAFDLARVERFEPPASRAVTVFAALQFALLLAASLVFLWHADALPLARSAPWLAAIAAGLWTVGAVMQGRLTMLQAVLVEVAALATASAADGWVDLHHVTKPLAMVLAILCLVERLGLRSLARGTGRWVALGLAFSLAGDCLLMAKGLFIPGLVSFLFAHLCYIAAFQAGVGFIPRRKALAGMLAYGVAMYAFLFPSLGPVLKVAVAAYVAVICTMGAQAIGRALVLRDRDAVAIAAGAVLFMASDSLLAVDRFAVQLPLAPLWILATYYAAQALITLNAGRRADALQSNSSPALFGGVTPR